MTPLRLIGLSWVLIGPACGPRDGTADPTGTTGAMNPTESGREPAMADEGTAKDTAGSMDAPDHGDDAGAEDGCCERHATGGCNEPAVAACVCDRDPSCCTFEWDDNCVDSARHTCRATCQASDGGTTDETDNGTSTVMDTGNPTESGPMDEGGEPSACCMSATTPGCADTEVETCVCAVDSYCCDRAWDLRCVSQADNRCGGMCVAIRDDNDCCVSHSSTGCDDMAVEDCVCGADAFCCEEAWDDRCVTAAADTCMAAC